MDNDNKATVNLWTIFLVLAILCLTIFILIYAKSILKPLVVAAIAALILLPIKQWYQKYLKYPAVSSFFSLITAMAPVTAIAIVVIKRVNVVLDNIPSIAELANNVIHEINKWIGKTAILESSDKINVEESIQQNSESIFAYLSDGISISSSVLLMILLTLISTFFFLWYSTAIKEFIIIQFSSSSRIKVHNTIYRLKSMLVKYVTGLMYVSLIMGVLNSLGLWALGVDYPFLWGFLAAMLAIVPYIGTAVGGLLPIMYVLGSGGEPLLALWIALFYLGLQQVEGNFITPKVVGDSIRVNPLMVIFSMLMGGLIWGVVGIIISLPLIGIIRILLDSFDATKPLGALISHDIHSRKHSIEEQYDHEVYRLQNIFKKRKQP